MEKINSTIEVSGKINKFPKSDLRSWEFLTLFVNHRTLSFRSYTALSIAFSYYYISFVLFFLSGKHHQQFLLLEFRFPVVNLKFWWVDAINCNNIALQELIQYKPLKKSFWIFKWGKKWNGNIYTKPNCIRMHNAHGFTVILIWFRNLLFPLLQNEKKNGLQKGLFHFFSQIRCLVFGK